MTSRSAMVYIVDDDVSVGRAVTLLLKPHGFRTETFSSAAEFLAFRHPKVPSCLVLDVRMPEINGLALQDAMAARYLSIPIVFITGHGDIPMSVRAMKAGAVDFLRKPFTENELLDAIGIALAKHAAQQKIQTDIDRINRRLKTLSPKEREVFGLVAQGFLNKEIAFKMGTVLQTIKVHRGRVMHKMQAKSVTELIHFAQKVGVVPPER
jgi:FixJ family two-component response regulator